MPIKKSSIEQDWYYRMTKIFFLSLPFSIVVFIFLSGYVDIANLSQKNIIYGLIMIVTYFLVLNGSWRIFLYLVFGGLENDTKKVINKAGQSSNSPIQSIQTQNSAGIVVGIIIGLVFFVIIIMLIIIYSNSNSSFNNLTKNTYGAFCVDSNGKEGLYSISGDCLTCSGSDSAVTNPVNNCSAGIAGVYCCK